MRRRRYGRRARRRRDGGRGRACARRPTPSPNGWASGRWCWAAAAAPTSGRWPDLARRHGRVAVVWLDAHGDLNTPESSPSGNLWGMPFRIILDAGDAAVEDCALLGARSLDLPEQQFIDRVGLARSGRPTGERARWCRRRLHRLRRGCTRPVRDRLLHARARRCPARRRARSGALGGGQVPLLGLGISGLVRSDANPERIDRMLRPPAWSELRCPGRRRGLGRMVRSKGCSSVGRAAVSKTVGRGFESCHPVPETRRGSTRCLGWPTADDRRLGSGIMTACSSSE